MIRELGLWPGMKPRTSLVIGLLLAAALIFSACGSGGATTATEAEPAATESPSTTSEPSGAAAAPGEKLERSVKVDISNLEYDPDPVRVEAGGKVIWLNEDSVAHTATADDGSFDTGEIEEGKLKSETFKQPGTYAYHCEIHPQMHGTIEVVEKNR
jgi:plastocyanin